MASGVSHSASTANLRDRNVGGVVCFCAERIMSCVQIHTLVLGQCLWWGGGGWRGAAIHWQFLVLGWGFLSHDLRAIPSLVYDRHRFCWRVFCSVLFSEF